LRMTSAKEDSVQNAPEDTQQRQSYRSKRHKRIHSKGVPSTKALKPITQKNRFAKGPDDTLGFRYPRTVPSALPLLTPMSSGPLCPPTPVQRAEAGSKIEVEKGEALGHPADKESQDHSILSPHPSSSVSHPPTSFPSLPTPANLLPLSSPLPSLLALPPSDAAPVAILVTPKCSSSLKLDLSLPHKGAVPYTFIGALFTTIVLYLLSYFGDHLDGGKLELGTVNKLALLLFLVVCCVRLLDVRRGCSRVALIQSLHSAEKDEERYDQLL